MLEFYRTVGGRKFVDHTIPSIADGLINLVEELRELRKLLRELLDARKESP